MHSVAVFDLDNTLVHGSSLFHFARFLVRRRVLSPRHVARFVLPELRYARGRGEQERSTSLAVLLALGLVNGVPHETMLALTDEFVRTRPSSSFNGAMVHEVRRQQARGVPCFIATASPQELADAFARRLEMEGAFGTVSEVVDGRYTGALIGAVCHGGAKAQRVGAGLAAQGLDLSHAMAFSDSVNDLPLLVAAGRPVAVNADVELAQIAERNGWPVFLGRRDRRRATQSLTAYLPFPM